MKKSILSASALLIASSLLALALPAQAGEAITKKARCVACHTVDTKRVGPAYKDVAAKYRGDKKAPALLFEKVRQGGTGNWGTVPMLPHPAEKISDDDLKQAIAWILALE